MMQHVVSDSAPVTSPLVLSAVDSEVVGVDGVVVDSEVARVVPIRDVPVSVGWPLESSVSDDVDASEGSGVVPSPVGAGSPAPPPTHPRVVCSATDATTAYPNCSADLKSSILLLSATVRQTEKSIHALNVSFLCHKTIHFDARSVIGSTPEDITMSQATCSWCSGRGQRDPSVFTMAEPM